MAYRSGDPLEPAGIRSHTLPGGRSPARTLIPEQHGNGNRLSVTRPGTGTIAGTYDAQDRLTTYGAVTYSYTANGDLQTATSGGETSTYNYDVFGNLTSVTLPNGTQIEYVIDGQNRRIGKKVNGNLVQSFVYSGRLRIAAELDGTGTVVSQFVYGIRHNVPDYMLKECAEWGTLHPDDPCATLPLARPRQPRRDPFRTSSGTLGPALRPGASTGALHAVIVRGLEQRAGFRDARHRGACVAPRTARAAAR